MDQKIYNTRKTGSNYKRKRRHFLNGPESRSGYQGWELDQLHLMIWGPVVQTAVHVSLFTSSS
jgi:hypothetical protein